jgi:putative DeoR family transcriptional regulator (stage III sporulation protein D)
MMNNSFRDRTLQIAHYIIDSGCTIRKAAAVYGISKSIVHRDVMHRLGEFDPCLYERVREVLVANYAQRHIRGGRATKERYVRSG